MKHHEVSGSLYACEKVYQWLSAKIGDDGDDYLEGETLDNLSMIDYARIVAENDFDIDEIDLDDAEENNDDFWVGAYGTWSEFKGDVARYRKKTV